MQVSDDMVSRFLTWPLPSDVSVDPCALVANYPDRCGTNLLNAPQARAMLEHVLGVAESPMTREWCAAFPGSAAWIINEFARRIDARDVELSRLRTALRFYARGEHYTLDEAEEFDTVSGEPQNWLCSGREESTTMVENGRVALFALQGIETNWKDGDEDNTPQPVEGEVTCAT